jgi:hypothetical protein
MSDTDMREHPHPLTQDIRQCEYLDDGVYAGYDGYSIWIWTSDGIHQRNHICLAPEMVAALASYANQLWPLLKPWVEG